MLRAYYAAQILDPYRKWAWFRQEWVLQAGKEKQKWFDNAQSAVKQLWETEYKGRYAVEMLPPPVRKERYPDPAFGRQREHKRIRIDAPVSAADLYEQYISTDRFHDDEAGCDEAIAYWLSRYDSQRDLARFALDLFAISPMSDECERLFSSAKLTIVDRRGRLKADIIEACECLRAWYGKPRVEENNDSEDSGNDDDWVAFRETTVILDRTTPPLILIFLCSDHPEMRAGEHLLSLWVRARVQSPPPSAGCLGAVAWKQKHCKSLTSTLTSDGVVEALLTAINEWAAPRGYAFITGRSSRSTSGRQIITYACDRWCRPPSVSLLREEPVVGSRLPVISKGAKVNESDYWQWTPLHHAARAGRTDNVQLLINEKAELHAVSDDGQTALHLAAENGILSVRDLLIENGARQDLLNNFGSTESDLL
ncbi:Uncharacterized protein HZ326_29773 [Fusarium oxysporum f. sp. albedinis]|nr:Uncharacterized protein HZ326_29773 [Fusarium oxysporum f. sp. albedinis]